MSNNSYDAPFMSRPLPELIDPLQLAEKGRELSGQVAISRFKRVTDALHDNEGCLDVSLRFAVDDAGQPNVRGWIRGDLPLVCQRCMQAMSWSLDIRICLGLIRSEQQIEKLPDQYEPVLVQDEPSLLVELIEDEVILALPQAPLHELEQCPAADLAKSLSDPDSLGVENTSDGFAARSNSKRSTAEGSGADIPDTDKRPNPFAVLEQLKKK